MKKIIIPIFIFLSFTVIAQEKESVNNSTEYRTSKTLLLYTFEETSGTFFSVSSTGTLLTPEDWDDGCTPSTPIGFDFMYNGLTYTEFSVNTNGTVNLGDQIINEETNYIESELYVNILCPLWDDLKFYSNGVGDGIYYELTGEVPDRVLTIEYNQVGRYNSTGFVDFQVKLYEDGSKIEFIYGDLSEATGWSEFSTTSIGINSVETDQTVFISISPDALNGASASYDVPNNNILPEQLAEIETGTIYSFYPPVITPGPDIAISSVLSPGNGLLSDTESIAVSLTNIGTEITENLTINYEIWDIDQNMQVASSSEAFETYGEYPVSTLETTDFVFQTSADLSDNNHYELTVTANLPGDLNPDNNELIININGVQLDELIYENGPIITYEGVGYNGADVSAVQEYLGMSDFGYNTNSLLEYRNADEFTVPEGEEWTISGFAFYNYQTDSGDESTIIYADFIIWDGEPDNGGNILYDFTSENMLDATFPVNVYRTPSSDLLNNQRPIMYNVCNFEEDEEIDLSAGTYWLDWSSEGELLSGPWQPFISILGETTTGNGIHFSAEGWVPMIDDGTETTQGMPFDIFGSISILSNILFNERLYSLFPNPTNSNLNISVASSCTIIFKDINGKEIFSDEITENKASYDLTGYSKGIYFVEFIFENKRIVEKLVIN